MNKSEPTVDKMADAKIEGKEDETVLVRLLPTEDFMLRMGNLLVTTLTWFQGEYTVAADKLQARLVALVCANPWLTGRIVRLRGTNYIAFTGAGNDEAALAKAARALFTLVPPEQSPLSRDTPIIQATSISRDAGYTCRATWNRPLYAVTVVPCRANPTSKFAVVVSMSHIVGDGHTFYSLHNYLIGGDENKKGNHYKQSTSAPDCCSLPHLQVERIATSLQDIGQVIHNYQTKDDPKRKRRPHEPLLTQSPCFLLPVILSLIAAKARRVSSEIAARIGQVLSLIAAKVRQVLSLNAAKVRPGLRITCGESLHAATLRYWSVDGEAIQRLKQEIVEQLITTNDSSASTSSADTFISTNDVIASWFMLKSGCRQSFMAVNVRGRVAGHESHHAGNYLKLVYYRVPEDCATPMLIRSSIEPLCRTVASSIPPSRWFGGGIALLTNWTSFATARVTLGENCLEELHVPLITDEAPPNMVVGVLFRACGNQLGICVCGTPSKLNGLDPCPFATESDFLPPVEGSHDVKCHVD
jgi:hypothetical protein